MENLKLLRKVRKISQQKTQRELREKNRSSSIFHQLNYDDEIISYTTESLNLAIFDYPSHNLIFITSFKILQITSINYLMHLF